MKKALIFLACCLIIAVVASLVQSAEINVPGDYSTIQAAIDASTSGDVILVGPGAYQENIDYKGKNVWLLSTHGPSVTVIEGDETDSVVIFQNGETSDAVLEGFTVTNGYGHEIAGSPSREEGGGILCLESDPTIVGNVIIDNYAEYGGGISINTGNPRIHGNRIVQNIAEGGGGIWAIGGEGEIDSNVISDNDATRGGGIYGHQAAPVIVNNMILNNAASQNGGALRFFNGCTPLVVNCTVVGNSAQSDGGGLYIALDSDVVMVNSILWGNTSPMGSQAHVDGMMGPVSLAISYSDVQYGLPAIFVTPPGTVNWGAGMIDQDPLFAEQAVADCHLFYSSPCRNAGDNSAVVISKDFEGDPRTVDGVVDLGADEFHTHLYYTGDATPGGQIKGKLVGLPGTTQVGLWFGSGVLDPPIPSAFGPWYLLPPLIGPIILFPIPATGIEVLPATLPAAYPGPYALPMQAIIGKQLTNLSLLVVN